MKGHPGVRILVFSDPHYAGPEERTRTDYEIRALGNSWVRHLLRPYRRHVWLRDPFAHNDQVHRLLPRMAEADLVVGNGDYSCDSGFIGVSDPAACASASECLQAVRATAGDRLALVMGDHELGKTSLGGRGGGIRFQSLTVARQELGIPTVWTQRHGTYLLLGVTSSLLAWPVYGRESLPTERAAWEQAVAEQSHQISSILETVKARDRLLIFCHDPTALPFLGQLPAMQRVQAQVERTVIGHLHSPKLFAVTQALGGLPVPPFLSTSLRRMAEGLRRAKAWRPFRPVLCPSLAGLEIDATGGYLELELSADGAHPIEITRNAWPRTARTPARPPAGT